MAFIIQTTDTEKLFQIINTDKIETANLDMGGEKPILELIFCSGQYIRLEGDRAMNFLNDELELGHQLKVLMNPATEEELFDTFGDM